MTPTQILTAAKNKYNAIGDSFFSDEELLALLYDACLDMNREALLIERSYSTTSVASQQEYSYPAGVISIKRVTYNGKRLEPITFTEDDSITGLNQSTSSTGTPAFFFEWNNTVSLRPVPGTDGDAIKIYTYDEPAAITAASTLEIPTQFHMNLPDYIVSEMAAKDQNFQSAQYYAQKWEKAKISAKRWAKKKGRQKGFNVVQSEELIE